MEESYKEEGRPISLLRVKHQKQLPRCAIEHGEEEVVMLDKKIVGIEY